MKKRKRKSKRTIQQTNKQTDRHTHTHTHTDQTDTSIDTHTLSLVLILTDCEIHCTGHVVSVFVFELEFKSKRARVSAKTGEGKERIVCSLLGVVCLVLFAWCCLFGVACLLVSTVALTCWEGAPVEHLLSALKRGKEGKGMTWLLRRDIIQITKKKKRLDRQAWYL